MLKNNRDLAVFWSVQTLSAAGDAFSTIAVPLLVLHATGSVAQMGLVTAVAAAANLLAGVFAGVIADRFDRRRLLIAADTARALLVAAIPVAWLFGSPVWLLYAVMPVAAVFSMLFNVTYVAVLPRLVGPDQITRANGLMSASYSVAGIAGPILAGLISAAFGPAAAMWVDAATYAVSAVGICFVRFRAPADPQAGPVEAASFAHNLLVGARFLLRHRVLRWMTVVLTMLIFVEKGVTDLVIYHLKHDLGQPDSAVGYALAVVALGVIAGSLSVARIRRRIGFGPTWIGCSMLAGVLIATIGFGTSVATVALGAAAAYFCVATAGICSQSLRQQVTPDALLGRVTSAFWTIHGSLGPLGATALTAASGRFGVRPVLLVAGLGYLGAASVALLTPIRLRYPEKVAVQPV